MNQGDRIFVYFLVLMTILVCGMRMDAQLNCSGGPLNCGISPQIVNGTTAQIFGVANTFTSPTNFEDFEINWSASANRMQLGGNTGTGGGTVRPWDFFGSSWQFKPSAIRNASSSVLSIDPSGNIGFGANAALAISGTAPTVSSGCGSVTTPTFGTGSSAVSWSLTMGSTPGASCVITLPTASNQWVCMANDTTTIADTTTQAAPLANNACTLKPLVSWGASDVLVGHSFAH